MVQARRKPEVVDAVQWQPGVTLPGLVERKTEIHYSDGGGLYYISRPGCRCDHWMSVETFAGEPSEADKQQAGGFFGPMIAQFTLKDGRRYWRKVYAFTTTKVRSGNVAPIGEDGDLFLDFASLERWSTPAAPTAVLGKGTTDAANVNAGDWVVHYPDGARRVMTDAAFRDVFDLEV